MPKAFSIPTPAKKARKLLEITSFAGVDLSSSQTDVNKRRSPAALNMMPDSLGNPIKRNGFVVTENYGAQINGRFTLGEHEIIHSGTKLYIDGEIAYEGMANALSSGQTVGEKLYIFDGLKALCYDKAAVSTLEDIAYIPTVLISKRPEDAEGEGEAGGVLKEEFNLLSSRWKESFLCENGTEKVFALSKDGLSTGEVKAYVLSTEGEWLSKTENVDFTVDRAQGMITFTEAVGATPIVGEDNLIIEAEKDFPGYKDRINRCRKSICFDNGGTSARIFLCGNPNEPNRDFWSAANDPSYFPDTYYSELGNSDTAIIGYSIIGDHLGTHIAPSLEGRSIVLRKGELDSEGNALFPIVKHLQGEEAVAENSFIFMEQEPLFLTKRGVYAVTAEDISGEKYTQNRSYYINKALCEEENLERAVCAKWKQFYLISLNGKLYILDTAQRSYEKGEPLSTFQYECYLWSGFDARVLWEKEGHLYFGDGEGNICYFKENHYSDNGAAIEAYWTVPDFAGEDFWKNKTVRTVAIEAEAYPLNKLRLEYRKKGVWTLLKEWTDKISFFAWNELSWESFTWSGNTLPRTLTLKAKIKKFDKMGFRIVCSEKDKAFGLCGFALEYTEGGRYKE